MKITQFTLDDHRHLFICGVSPPSIEAAEQCLLYRGRSTILLMPPPVGLQHTTRQQSILQKYLISFSFPNEHYYCATQAFLARFWFLLSVELCRNCDTSHCKPPSALFANSDTFISGAAALSTLYFSEKRAMLAESSNRVQQCNSAIESSNSATLPQAHASLTTEPLCHKTSAKAWSLADLETMAW